MNKSQVFQTLVVAMLLSGCAVDSPVQKVSESTSRFGKNPPLMSSNVPSHQMFRIFEQASTGWVTIASLRESAEQRAEQFCERQGKGTLILGQQKSNPPYILGNFPRLEIVFACTDKPAGTRASGAVDDQYTKLSNLKKLLDEGAITQQEFDQQKARILSRY